MTPVDGVLRLTLTVDQARDLKNIVALDTTIPKTLRKQGMLTEEKVQSVERTLDEVYKALDQFAL